MTDLAQIRQELDELLDRMTCLESQATLNSGDIATAQIMAREADRNTFGYRAEVREGFAKINADLAQITTLLVSSSAKPGER